MPEKIRPFIRLSPDGRVRELSGWRVRRQGQLLARDACGVRRPASRTISSTALRELTPAPGNTFPQQAPCIASEAGGGDLLLRFDHGTWYLMARLPVSVSLCFQRVDDRLGVGDPGVGVGLVDLLAAEYLNLDHEYAEYKNGAGFFALVHAIEGHAQRLGQDLLDPMGRIRGFDLGDQVLDRRGR